jgi:hypothetical protein
MVEIHGGFYSIEFQDRRSHEPMEWRMLDYMTHLAYTYHLEVWSVVI